MENKFSFKILSILILIFSCLYYGQDINKQVVLKKLKQDKNSYELFVFYGFCLCQDKLLRMDTFGDNYTSSFNNGEPFPRLFEPEDIKNNFLTLQKNIIINEQNNRYYNGYNIVKKCNLIYDKNNSVLKKEYNKFISDKELQKKWIDDDMKNYLENYFIKVQTE